ncbi:GH116 family glycosyl-hydrolase [Paraglaciecola sp. L3A3]|uniref:GH116 family glycosyl-hydrolase n=1 Tax=Paraglaciecola sp. L3A3 TaxID=2686358 RepID=UPI00131E4E3A|nr:GH116 family glycosyl-hydrolase [Paraglaciecola sp. L3A3]
MKNLFVLIVLLFTNGFTYGQDQSNTIMQKLQLSSDGKTPTVKNFPANFPQVLTQRGQPLVYSKNNSNNFEYIGMPVGGIGAGQLYLGGDGKLWFWDIFNLNYNILKNLKGEEAYEFPYERSKGNDKGARDIEHGFVLTTQSQGKTVSKILDRHGIDKIQFKGQYPIGNVTYQDDDLPVEVNLEAFSPFMPLNVDDSAYPATILNFSVKNTSNAAVSFDLTGWIENAVFTESKTYRKITDGKLLNSLSTLDNGGLRLDSTVVFNPDKSERADIVYDDFENGLGKWQATGRAFVEEASPYNNAFNNQPSQKAGNRIADSRLVKDQSNSTFDNRLLGTLTSKPFTINRDYLTALIGGGDYKTNGVSETGLRVLVDGKPIASIHGERSEFVTRKQIDLTEYQGQQAQIEIFDLSKDGWAGYVIVDQVVLTDIGLQPQLMQDYGSMSLSLLNRGATGSADLNLPVTGIPNNSKTHSSAKISATAQLIGGLSTKYTLQPGDEKTVKFLLTWHFPNTKVAFSQTKKRHYAERFANATSVSEHLIRHLPSLENQTKLWKNTWYDSTLPYWFLDRTFLNISILASGTSHILEGKQFYGYEGGYQGTGTCTHVWGYAQGLGRLFPELEINLREKTDLVPQSESGAMMENGVIKFRWMENDGAVDGQAGIILRSYLAHQMSVDNTFLQQNYQALKKAMAGLTEVNDADHDGILTGAQHNTLDADWYGKVAWLSMQYNAALLAMAEMADEMGDRKYAEFNRNIARKGKEFIENDLFNGEYFFHIGDPEHENSPGIYTGNEYSQMLGQSWAYHVGLGSIIDKDKITTALDSIWKYNFTTDVGPYRQQKPAGRWYAMPGEGAFIAATWPRGGSEVLDKGEARFAAYNNESQNGYEYALSSLMMWHGMPHRSLAHIWYMHNQRYHGSKRNAWAEVEWGIHYARSMASFGHFTAISGFEYHGPKGYLAFSPKITPEKFKAPAVTADAWLTFEQTRNKSQQTESISIKHGSLVLNKLAFSLEDQASAKTVVVSVNGNPVTTSYFQNEDKLVIDLPKMLTLKESDSVLVSIKHN